MNKGQRRRVVTLTKICRKQKGERGARISYSVQRDQSFARLNNNHETRKFWVNSYAEVDVGGRESIDPHAGGDENDQGEDELQRKSNDNVKEKSGSLQKNSVTIREFRHSTHLNDSQPEADLGKIFGCGHFCLIQIEAKCR
jgi:hypothetical protein